MTDESPADTRVLYNADCPVCAFEINHYDAYAKERSLPIRFEDLNAQDLDTWGLDPETAAKRLHVLHDGTLHAGVPAFIVLWREMPRYHWLAKVVALRGIHALACAVYDYILAPLLYAWHKRRVRRQAVAKG